jgi:Mg2+ and Co2+ transporter CorA
MDHAMQLRHLEEADRHVAQGERHIAEQEERIAGFARRGQDTAEAQKLLDSFYASQVQHVQHRDEYVER